MAYIYELTSDEFNPNLFDKLIRNDELTYHYLKDELIMMRCPKDQINNMIARIRLLSAISESNITTSAQLVESSGVNKGSISQYINGLHIPSSINAKKLADVLNVNPLWLMAFDAPRRYSGYVNYVNKEPLHELICEKFDALDDSQKTLVLKMLGIE